MQHVHEVVAVRDELLLELIRESHQLLVEAPILWVIGNALEDTEHDTLRSNHFFETYLD